MPACRGHGGGSIGEGPFVQGSARRGDRRSFRVVYRDQTQPVEVVDLLHGLTEAQAEGAAMRAQKGAIDLDPLIGVALVASRWRDPLAHDGSPDPVDHELVPAAVPRKEYRAGSATAIQLPR